VTAVPDYATAATQDTAAYGAFFHAMLDAGVYLPPSAYEGWFLSAAHDDAALDRVVSALPVAAAAAAAAAGRG
jgi:glutamate-1-semialdehyde 2,1-aminomutase